MGIPWDGTGIYCYGMGCDGTDKYVPWTTLEIFLLIKTKIPHTCYWNWLV